MYRKKLSTSIASLALAGTLSAQAPSAVTKPLPNDFLWGIGTAAYQVEGAYQADGKGASYWDYYANTLELTKHTVGEKQTGNVAINMYDRKQYLKDIALMKELGVNVYRFSIPWSRIIPDGTGKVNKKAVSHYHQLIKDLKVAGLQPFVTLYHFDMPQALVERGGWANKESVQWYEAYSDVIFNEFGNEVQYFSTFNETTMEFFIADYNINPTRSAETANVRYAKEMDKVHNQLLASATAIRSYHAKHLKGVIGITFNLAPCLPLDPDNPDDVAATPIEDALLNRIVLDPTFKGSYPEEALSLIQKYNPEFKPSDADMALMNGNRPDFLGVNFYAPALVKSDPQAAMGMSWLGNNTDTVKMSNGPVRPDYLYKLLIRLKEEYGNPRIFITENGSSFTNGEDRVVDGKVNDLLRSDYIKTHVAAALEAKKQGSNLDGYFVWSGWDNFEWTFGYTIRFGIIYVDFTTQQRIPKKSFYTYQAIVKQHQ